MFNLSFILYNALHLVDIQYNNSKSLAQLYLRQFKVVGSKREPYPYGYHKVTENLLIFFSGVKGIGLSGPGQEESILFFYGPQHVRAPLGACLLPSSPR